MRSPYCDDGRRPVSDALRYLLSSRNIDTVGLRVPFEHRKIARLGPQYIAVEMLVRSYNITSARSHGRLLFSCDNKNIRIIGGRGRLTARYSLSGRGEPVVEWRELESLLPDPPVPVVAVDLGLLGIHSDEERASLRIQIAMALAKVREYLWDKHLALTSAPEGVQGWLEPVVGRNRMIISKAKPGEVFWRLRADNVIILRPDADEKLTAGDIVEAEGFLIGGIVDKIPRPGISRILDSLVPWGRPRRLVLRGSIIGVPERINRIIEIILKTRYDFLGDLESAIVSSMSKADKVNRLFYEFTKMRVKSIDICEILDEYSWLQVTPDVIRIAARRAHVDLRGGECLENKNTSV